MFPTRTTSTTGALRVPAAPEPAPTSFGWATTTPTLSLRVTPPEAVPAPTPAGEASPPAPRAGQDAPAPVPAPAAEAPPRAAAPAPDPATAEPDRASGPVPDFALRAAQAPLGAHVPSRAAEPRAGTGSRPAALSADSGPALGRVATAEPDRASGPVPGSAPRVADAPLPAAAPAPLGAQASPRATEPLTGPAATPASAQPRAQAEPRTVPAAAPASVEPQGGTGFRPAVVSASAEPGDGVVPRSALRAASVAGRTAAAAPAPFSAHVPSRAAEPRAEAGSRPTALSANSGPALGRVATAEGDRSSGPVSGSAPRVADAPLPAAAPAPLGAQASPGETEPRTVPVATPASAQPRAQAEPLTGPAGGVASAEAEAEMEAEAAVVDVAVPAARGESDPEPVHTSADSASGGPHIPHPHPHPHPQHEDDPRHEEPDTAPHSGVPGPGVAEIVAQAVARGMEDDDDTQDLPKVAAPHRGTAVTEVPVHLPFRATTPAPLPEPAPRPAARPVRPARPAPGRRVPRGDDHLREHRGPVLPGWVGVAVGGLALAGCTAVLWRAGVVPAPLVAAFGAAPRAYQGLRATHWPPLAFLGIVALVALGGLGRARTGHAWVLTLFGRYRGTVRRTGLTWVSPLLLRRRVDVRLRHWRSDPMPAVDSGGLALQVVVQVVWQVKDTARATLAVADHTEYLAEQVESAMARVLSQLPADAFHEDAPTLRDAEAVGDALTRMLAAETEAVGIEVYSAQPTRIEYAPEVAEAMRRRRVAAIDAKHRDTVLTSVVDAVDDTVHRLTSRGLVELDDYERKALVKDLTVAFYTGRTE
ncbi:SPFH domain-containing protein [Streptomyces virginiae]|uniref:SPFH domain-containing protein n=4 Tax=Streptomyces TaxID=1883 RepID=UPI002DBB87F7|nr:SPFH domain-containing protein [Streptomyces sp. CMAA1738]MEC4575971.1 SPFH domain-containing protein [Streptomyces sp. CMAA1738]